MLTAGLATAPPKAESFNYPGCPTAGLQQTNWTYVEPTLKGPSKYWYAGVAGQGKGSNNYQWTYAVGNKSSYVNYAEWCLSDLVGTQELAVWIPNTSDAVATVTYEIHVRDCVRAGCVVSDVIKKKVAQRNYGAQWVSLGKHNFNGLDVGVHLYDNASDQDYRTDGKARSKFAADQIIMRCVSSCTTATAPTAPQNLALNYSGSALTVTWNPPSSDGNSQISTYNLSATVNGSTTRKSFSGTARRWVINNPTTGSSYRVSISASNSAGTSPSASKSISIPRPTTTTRPTTTNRPSAENPSQPRNLSLSYDATSKSLTINWDAPTSNGGSSIASYNVFVISGSFKMSELIKALQQYINNERVTNSDVRVHTANGDANQHVVSQLEAGYTYHVAVRATNSSGRNSDYARLDIFAEPEEEETQTREPPASAPSEPRNISLTHNRAQKTIEATWNAPFDTGGDITSYSVGLRGAGRDIADVRYGSSNRKVFRNIAAGHTYTFRVHANNAAGAGTRATKSIVVAPDPRKPGAVSNLRISSDVSSGTPRLNLAWSAPNDAGTSPISGYDIVLKSGTSSGSLSNSRTVTVGPNTLSWSSNVAWNRYFAASVAARSSVGVGEKSLSQTIKIAPRPQPPSAPRSITATYDSTVGARRLNVDWFVPSDAGSSPITGYQVKISGGEYRSPSVSTHPANKNGLILRDPVHDATYSFEIRAINSAGLSQPARVTKTIPPEPIIPTVTTPQRPNTPTTSSTQTGTPDSEEPSPRPPSAVRNIKLRESSDINPAAVRTRIVLTWSAPGDPGTSDISSYEIVLSSGTSSSSLSVLSTETAGPNANQWTFIVDRNRYFAASVTARSDDGLGETATTRRIDTYPPKPTKVRCTNGKYDYAHRCRISEKTNAERYVVYQPRFELSVLNNQNYKAQNIGFLSPMRKLGFVDNVDNSIGYKRDRNKGRYWWNVIVSGNYDNKTEYFYHFIRNQSIPLPGSSLNQKVTNYARAEWLFRSVDLSKDCRVRLNHEYTMLNRASQSYELKIGQNQTSDIFIINPQLTSGKPKSITPNNQMLFDLPNISRKTNITVSVSNQSVDGRPTKLADYANNMLSVSANSIKLSCGTEKTLLGAPTSLNVQPQGDGTVKVTWGVPRKREPSVSIEYIVHLYHQYYSHHPVYGALRERISRYKTPVNSQILYVEPGMRYQIQVTPVSSDGIIGESKSQFFTTPTTPGIEAKKSLLIGNQNAKVTWKPIVEADKYLIDWRYIYINGDELNRAYTSLKNSNNDIDKERYSKKVQTLLDGEVVDPSRLGTRRSRPAENEGVEVACVKKHQPKAPNNFYSRSFYIWQCTDSSPYNNNPKSWCDVPLTCGTQPSYHINQNQTDGYVLQFRVKAFGRGGAGSTSDSRWETQWSDWASDPETVLTNTCRSVDFWKSLRSAYDAVQVANLALTVISVGAAAFTAGSSLAAGQALRVVIAAGLREAAKQIAKKILFDLTLKKFFLGLLELTLVESLDVVATAILVHTFKCAAHAIDPDFVDITDVKGLAMQTIEEVLNSPLNSKLNKEKIIEKFSYRFGQSFGTPFAK